MWRVVRNGRQPLRTAKQILAQISQVSFPRIRSLLVTLSQTGLLMTLRLGRGSSRNGMLRARHGGPACEKMVSLRRPAHKAGASLRARLSLGVRMAWHYRIIRSRYASPTVRHGAMLKLGWHEPWVTLKPPTRRH